MSKWRWLWSLFAPSVLDILRWLLAGVPTAVVGGAGMIGVDDAHTLMWAVTATTVTLASTIMGILVYRLLRFQRDPEHKLQFIRIMVLDLAVLARWDDGRGSAFCQPVAQGFAVIALVGDEFGGGRHGFDTALGDLAIMDVSWCQEQDEGPAFRIADSVELGVAAPLGAADAMGQGPPFPPPAQR